MILQQSLAEQKRQQEVAQASAPILKQHAEEMRQLYEDQKKRLQTIDDKSTATPPWTQPPPTNDPLKMFSSAAGLFALAAAAFTRTPAISAMNGLAAAIQGRQ